nr:putative ribonuclease H-like domain-containing protein [Tanacetum cinerariifolium]
KIVPQYVLFPVWSSGSINPHNTYGDAAFDEKEPEFEGRKPESKVNVSPSKFEDFSDNSINEDNAAGTLVPTVGQISPNSTNTFSAAELEDITYSDDEDDVGAEADFNNLETSITVSPIPITHVHKDHHVTQNIGDLSLATQTRSMTRVAKHQGGLSQIKNEDFHTCKFACFLSQEKPKRVHQALKDPSWIDVARIEAIRLFLAYASFMGFMVYQMDVKSAFLYGTIEEEVYVYQPLGFEDLDYPDKVYKVVKALYGLHQAPRAWYETLANYRLENGFQRGKIDQTLFIKRQKGDILLVQIYVDDIIFGLTNKDLCKAFEKLLKDKFQMSSMGELTFFLGLQ